MGVWHTKKSVWKNYFEFKFKSLSNKRITENEIARTLSARLWHFCMIVYWMLFISKISIWKFENIWKKKNGIHFFYLNQHRNGREMMCNLFITLSMLFSFKTLALRHSLEFEWMILYNEMRAPRRFWVVWVIAKNEYALRRSNTYCVILPRSPT